MSSVQLKVAEAKQQRDVGRSIARMDSETMKTLGVTVGDVVEIVGKKSTTAKAWPAYPEDQGLSLLSHRWFHPKELQRQHQRVRSDQESGG